MTYEIHGRGDDVNVGRHHQHTTDAPGIGPVAFISRTMDEERGNCPRELCHTQCNTSEGEEDGPTEDQRRRR